jgi:hypothetical protein
MFPRYSRHGGPQMTLFCDPVLMDFKSTALRFSKITIFGSP